MDKKSLDKKIGFSPIHVNASLLSSDRVLSLYHFARTIFPQIGQAISTAAFGALFDDVRQWTDSITEKERKELTQSLKGLSISINISIDEEGKGGIVSIPFYIKTDYILENLIKAKPDVTRLDTEIKEIKEIFLPVIKGAIKQRLKEMVEGFLTLEVFKPEIRVEIKQLIEKGLITCEGKIAEGVDLDTLFCDEYASLFKKVDLEELARAGLIKKGGET